MAKITADTLIAECLEINPNAPEILMSAGMHCFGCAMAHGETVAEAVAVHGEDLDALLAKLNGSNSFAKIASALSVKPSSFSI